MRSLLDRLRHDTGLAALVLAVAAAIALYAPTLARGLVDYDDSFMIADNWIVQDMSWSSLRTIFFDIDLGSPARFALSPEYLPVRDLSIMFDVAIWGEWYPGFHLTNLALYLSAIVVWFAAFEAFGIERKVAGLAILIWAVHPTHAESVAWLAERKGLLAALFAGAACLAYARFRAGRHAGWLAVAALTAVAAVWSKAPAVFAIAALAGLELALPTKRVSRARSLVGLGVLAVVSAAAFVPVVYLATSSSVIGTDAAGPASRLAMVFGVHGFYLQLAAMVHSNAVSYPISLEGPSVVQIVLGAAGIGFALVVVFAPRRYAWSPSDAFRACAILWLVTYLPFSHAIVPLQMIVVADRYMLFPTLGLALGFAVAVQRISSARARRALIGVVVVAAAMRTFDAQSNWRDGRTLWERAVQSNPHDGDAWSAYADAMTKAGNPVGAAQVTSRGLKLSRSPRLLLRKALILLEHGNRHDGLLAMRDAAEAGEARAMSNLALLLLEVGQREEAIEWSRRGASAMPMYAPAMRALGRVTLASGNTAEALFAFTRAYGLEPRSCVNRFNLALAQIARGLTAEAREHLRACADNLLLGDRVRAELATLPP